jgi:hypothetical protein
VLYPCSLSLWSSPWYNKPHAHVALLLLSSHQLQTFLVCLPLHTMTAAIFNNNPFLIISSLGNSPCKRCGGQGGKEVCKEERLQFSGDGKSAADSIALALHLLPAARQWWNKSSAEPLIHSTEKTNTVTCR